MGFRRSTTFGGKQQLPDASHCCHNRYCVNPAHMVFECRTLNQLRYGCRNGNANQCHCHKRIQHESDVYAKKRCIWVRHGHWLPCQNDENKREHVCEEGCKLDCFGKFFCNRFSYLLFYTFSDVALNKLDMIKQLGCDVEALAEQSDEEEIDTPLTEDAEDFDSQTEDEAPPPKRARENSNRSAKCKQSWARKLYGSAKTLLLLVLNSTILILLLFLVVIPSSSSRYFFLYAALLLISAFFLSLIRRSVFKITFASCLARFSDNVFNAARCLTRGI